MKGQGLCPQAQAARKDLQMRDLFFGSQSQRQGAMRKDQQEFISDNVFWISIRVETIQANRNRTRMTRMQRITADHLF
jgi:hypothetical protein